MDSNKQVYRVEVERRDIYEIEIDENVVDDQWVKNFNDNFYDADNQKDLAEHIAQFRARFGERFIEGFGNPLVNGDTPAHLKYTRQVAEVAPEFNINVISEDEQIDVWATKKVKEN